MADSGELFRIIVVRGMVLIGVYIVRAGTEAEAIKKFKAESDRSLAVCDKRFSLATDLVAASKLETNQDVTCVFLRKQR